MRPVRRKPIVKMFYDLETTGTNVFIHGIHQISGVIEVDGEIVEEFDFYVAPNPKAKIDPAALAISGLTEEQIRAYPDMMSVYKKLMLMVSKYVQRYDPKDKIWLVGFNNRKFDDVFFRAWFVQNGDGFFGSYFWSDSLDAIVFASQYLIERRREMPSFKLHRVAKELGIVVDDTKLHEGVYDVKLTRMIYRIVTGIDLEI